MRLLWLCNLMPGKVKEKLYGSEQNGGLWVDHVLSDLRQLGMTILILCPGDGSKGELDEKCSFATFQEPYAFRYQSDLENDFSGILETYNPDVLHIWGSEFGHTLAMINAAEKKGILDRTVISIQGLSWACAVHYMEGLPESIQRMYTFRDLIRRDNIVKQQRKFELRGKMEIEALQKVRHVIGRTQWDKACTWNFHPEVKYHFCNETLRQPFYEGLWHYDTCKKYRIFASSCAYPIKGFHWLLEAFADIVKHYPDATLAVPGRSFLSENWKERLHLGSYEIYLRNLVRQHNLAGRIFFLGDLSAEQMREAFLEANVFVMPSSIENSSNSLGEAMLLGMPCVASNVGGTKELMADGREGYLYQSTASYLLAYHIQQIFAMEKQAEMLGQAARSHAMRTHDPETNLKTLLEIYQSLL